MRMQRPLLLLGALVLFGLAAAGSVSAANLDFGSSEAYVQQATPTATPPAPAPTGNLAPGGSSDSMPLILAAGLVVIVGLAVGVGRYAVTRRG